jgi:hypothetical protein
MGAERGTAEQRLPQFAAAGTNVVVRDNELRNTSRRDFQGTFGVLAQPRDCDIASVSFAHVAGDACNFVGVCRPGGMRADADVLQGGFWTFCLRDGAVTLDGVSKARVPEWVVPALKEAVYARHDFVRGQFVVEVGTRSYEFSTGVMERALRLCLAAAKGNAIRVERATYCDYERAAATARANSAGAPGRTAESETDAAPAEEPHCSDAVGVSPHPCGGAAGASDEADFDGARAPDTVTAKRARAGTCARKVHRSYSRVAFASTVLLLSCQRDTSMITSAACAYIFFLCAPQAGATQEATVWSANLMYVPVWCVCVRVLRVCL